MSKVDLHLHTSFSDGRLTPLELVTFCYEKGLKVIAISDHDTTEGISQAKSVGCTLGMEVVSAIELGTSLNGAEIHVLGYFIEPEQIEFQETLVNYREARVNRTEGIVSKLNALGISLSWEQVSDLAGIGSIGRPHIAYALVKYGYVNNIREAFDIYLKPGTLAYIPRDLPTPHESVRMIKENGGVPVLAHPLFTKSKSDRYDIPFLEDLVESLCEEGLKGLEVFYGDYTEGQIEKLLNISSKYDLVPCGGSDYHATGARDEVIPGETGPSIEHFLELKNLSNVV